MPHSNEHHYVTTWRVEGIGGEVADVLREPLDLVRWWPSVYQGVEEIERPDPRGLGQRVRLRAKGWMPGTLQWECLVTESRYPSRLAFELTGDVVGRGEWTIDQEGPVVAATFDWRFRVETPLLRRVSPLTSRLLAANYRWAMAQGEESLRLELARRRASTAAARAAVPPPPGPVTLAAVGLIGGAAVVGATVAYLLLRHRKSSNR